jgi:hypothetical protein
MGVWDLKGLDDQVKKYLKLSLDEGFDQAQRAKFGVIAIEARGHLERLKAQWEENAKAGKGKE